MPLFRALTPLDAGGFQDHMLRLGPEERAARFSGYLSDDAVIRYCEGISWLRESLIGAFEDAVIRAAVHLPFVETSWPRVVEMAVTVEKEWQSKGIGTELCRRALVFARNRRVSHVTMLCLLENARMQRIARRLKGKQIALDGVVESVLDLSPSDPLSLWQEALDSTDVVLCAVTGQLVPRSSGKIAGPEVGSPENQLRTPMRPTPGSLIARSPGSMPRESPSTLNSRPSSSATMTPSKPKNES